MRLPDVRRMSTRAALVLGLILAVVLGGTGLATAEWIIKGTVSAPATAGTLSTDLSGTAALGTTEITSREFTSPVVLTLHNPNPVPVTYSLQLDAITGNLDPAQFELAVWESPSPVCPATVPATGISSGTFADALELSTVAAPAESVTVVCAATRFGGPLASIDERSLTLRPTLTATLATGEWTATAPGDEFTHALSAPAIPTPEVSLPNPVANLWCTDVGDHPHNSGVELSWLPVPETTSYQVLNAQGGVLMETMLTSAFLDESSWSTGRKGTAQFEVVAVTANGTSTVGHQSIFLAQGNGMGNHLRCGR